MSDYALSRFAGLVGDGFDLVEAPGTTWTLAEATSHGEMADPASHGSFSLVFRGAPTPLYAQQTVTLRHPAIGDQTIFVVPIAADAAGVSYEAVFN